VRHFQAAEVSGPGRPIRRELTALRQSVSIAAGSPLIMVTHSDSQCVGFARRDDVASVWQEGPAVPDHAVRTKRVPLLGRDVGAYADAYERYIAAYVPADAGQEAVPDCAPRVILDPELGMCALGRTVEEATSAAQIYRHTMEIIRAARVLEAYRPLPASDVLEVEVEESPTSGPPVFAGEVALVTGAASGIGKACVESLLARGAAVAGLDVNPRITQILERPDFLGLCCDVADEDALCQAIETVVRAFGGLDVLVPNAGVFPPGCPIASLSADRWRQVMSINLDANLVLMREAFPLLKAAPRGGRVVVISSRNVPAPGPGAAAYSASKAALTQLARVAALEWAKDGIRVNILNPHAVFDTGIWTDEVLSARAAHYGLTVDEYKRNNLLRAEITSRDVGELVAEMCGPLFAKSTGAQVPIDGGSDRVI
jgi:NAD(P)-dependent dehydrogenase (short-subunit alcohol dehydrogenase family)